MGGRASFKPFAIRYFSSAFIFTAIILLRPWFHAEADDSRETPPNVKNVGGVANGDSPTPSTLAVPEPGTTGQQKFHFFNPSVAVVVGVLTSMLSLTFLLLLYAKHCKRGNAAALPGFRRNQNSRGPPPSAARKNSGINRGVIESLPIFRFGSLSGEKDGLECAVCLTRFESTDVLRLLPKCKHAFHVECVDTWLDAHSTCPLCRCRVDPEDILLVEDDKILRNNQPIPAVQEDHDPEETDIEAGTNGLDPESNHGLRRVSGRHSSAFERGLLQIIMGRATGKEPEREAVGHETTSRRRSLDSAGTPYRTRRNSEPVAVDCFERPRRDGLLLSQDKTRNLEHRLEHRIIVSPSPKSNGLHQHRWSDVQASDLLYLTSEKIISDSRSRMSSSSASAGSRRSASRVQRQNVQLALHRNTRRGGTVGMAEA
ncbi:hypothetical protein L6164_011720 [Bauhinia variegata]|uniref:Uncharacterized protein n=1 Tax=Bauhinia variegata TaxID=167791 RepID=A0ACB9P860_BAUVA|nr:hypothetical protein L6164_011720 [Bauhinia variegata]